MHAKYLLLFLNKFSQKYFKYFLNCYICKSIVNTFLKVIFTRLQNNYWRLEKKKNYSIILEVMILLSGILMNHKFTNFLSTNISGLSHCWNCFFFRLKKTKRNFVYSKQDYWENNILVFMISARSWPLQYYNTYNVQYEVCLFAKKKQFGKILRRTCRFSSGP